MLDYKRKAIIFKSTTFFTAEIRKYIAVDVRHYKRTKKSTGCTLWVTELTLLQASRSKMGKINKPKFSNEIENKI